MVIPTLRYQDASAAIDYLRDVFGFKEHVIHRGEGEQIEHAQMTFGSGLIMLSSERDSPFDELVARVDDQNGKSTNCIYVVVKDLKAHYEKVKQAGANIVIALAYQEHGGGYCVKDCEGHLWSFGDYMPDLKI